MDLNFSNMKLRIIWITCMSVLSVAPRFKVSSLSVILNQTVGIIGGRTVILCIFPPNLPSLSTIVLYCRRDNRTTAPEYVLVHKCTELRCPQRTNKIFHDVSVTGKLNSSAGHYKVTMQPTIPLLLQKNPYHCVISTRGGKKGSAKLFLNASELTKRPPEVLDSANRVLARGMLVQHQTELVNPVKFPLNGPKANISYRTYKSTPVCVIGNNETDGYLSCPQAWTKSLDQYSEGTCLIENGAYVIFNFWCPSANPNKKDQYKVYLQLQRPDFQNWTWLYGLATCLLICIIVALVYKFRYCRH